jgi:isochorismate synthase/2-succinyl-5-enolpyruvyl-6-hydroxy-3-cyclohexene-1-carboxylate synthase/2-succinyl-6-hydroxy-2,4-cyclohexadiene-1-carboxylate synthase/O-succinylbenzoate synthase
VLIYGEKDTKFKTIAQEMFYEACRGFKSADDLWNETHEIVEIPNCGHAAHLENPLPIISALRQFLTKLKTTSFSI